MNAREAVIRSLEAISAIEPLHVFLTVDAEGALARAEALDARIHAGEDVGVLAGVPVAIKDNLATIGLRTTAGSRMLDRYRPPYSATAVERLEAAGAIVIGKTNLDEFSMGSSTENSAFGPTRNPWDPTRIPGGSSGGSAAAVATGAVALALGSDTGGSIRQPAALCGVVGLKPTWGRVSRFGLIAYASSLDQVGPIARTVREVAQVYQVIAGPDPRDMTSVQAPAPDVLANLEGGVRGLRVGIPSAWLEGGLDPSVVAAVEGVAKRLEAAGASVRPITLPDTEACLSAYYVIAPAEAASNLGRYDGIRYGHRAARATGLADLYERSRSEGFGPEVTRRILLGTYVLSAGYADQYYGRAQRVRNQIRAAFTAVLNDVDLILAPTTPGPAPRLGEVQDPLAMYLLDMFTIAANLVGVPAIHVPTGLADNGLPVGVQLLGRAFDEATLLRAARAVELAANAPMFVPEVRAS